MSTDISYALPLLARLLSYFFCAASNPAAQRIPGLYSLGRFSIPLNILGLLFLVFASITFNFPTLNPVTADNMNYTSAAVGVIMLVAIVTWVVTGKKQFRGPESGGVVIKGESVGVAHGVASGDGEGKVSGEKEKSREEV